MLSGTAGSGASFAGAFLRGGRVAPHSPQMEALASFCKAPHFMQYRFIGLLLQFLLIKYLTTDPTDLLFEILVRVVRGFI
jgi:hypothetical protein